MGGPGHARTNATVGREEAASRHGVVLYLAKDCGSYSCVSKMAGIRRYCLSRGWDAEWIYRPSYSAAELAAIVARHRPIGCVADGVSGPIRLPPRLFRGIPLSCIGYPRGTTGDHPNFHFDAAAIAKSAFLELSANRPPCYAAVGCWVPMLWSRRRIGAFRAVARAAAAKCRVFSAKPRPADESPDDFARRLALWLASLPMHCAVFAVSDETAALVVRAAHAAHRAIPGSLTLLSVDNFQDICEKADPPISSIQLDFERLGYIAAKAVGEMLDSRKAAAAENPMENPLSAGPGSIAGPLLVVRRKSTAGRGRHEKFIIDAVEAIRAGACDGLSAAALIARYPVSKRLFTMRFREATGHSVLDEITHVRLEKACELLARTDTPVAAVADFCGFGSYQAADWLFRKRFGLSMGAWRAANAAPRA